MAYVYQHIRLDNNQVFYIGSSVTKEGNHYKRANSKMYRNKFWYAIVDKTEYKVEILVDNITREQAFLKEKELILKYGTICDQSGILANITDGGAVTKLKMVIPKTEEHKLKIKKALTNFVRTEEHQSKLSKAMKGRKFSEDGRKACSKRSTGGKNPMARKVIDISTGVIYDCIKDAAAAINISATYLRCFLLGYFENKTNIIYYYGDNN